MDYRGRVTIARILVAIPAWNEEGSIAQVIDQVGELVPQADVLVVDDGSTDETARLAREAGAQVASLPFNVGVGGAMERPSSLLSATAITRSSKWTPMASTTPPTWCV